MEQKDIDIYEILKDVPKGTEFYTSLCGNVGLAYLESNKEAGEAIWTENKNGEYSFNKNGRWMEGGEVLLLPSKEMRDWNKFFKKGDVLVHRNGDIHVIFEGFKDNRYTRFKGKHYLWKECLEDYNKEVSEMITFTFRKASDDEAKTYINTLEKHFGGKLNRETLEIEKTQPEFNDGDIVFVGSYMLGINTSSMIAIFRKEKEIDKYKFSPALCESNEHDTYLREDTVALSTSEIMIFRPATDSEKQQLFDALAKEGKAWDSEKKQIVGLKPAFEIGKLYVFNEEDEDGELTIIGKLIDKNESEDTLRFGNQYEIENEKFVTDQTFDLRISVNKELREATENEVELFNKHYDIWKNGKEAKEQPAFKPFDKVLVRSGREFNWYPALFVRDRGENSSKRYTALPIHIGTAADFSSCIPFEGHENIAFTDYDIENLPF